MSLQPACHFLLYSGQSVFPDCLQERAEQSVLVVSTVRLQEEVVGELTQFEKFCPVADVAIVAFVSCGGDAVVPGPCRTQ